MKKKIPSLLLLATMFLLFACEENHDKPVPPEFKLTKTEYTMNHGEKQDIEGTNISDIVWDSENEFVATVDDGIITGRYVGEAAVKSTKDDLSFTVRVEPKYHTYEEPYLEWGASQAEIKAKYGRTPISEEDGNLIYLSTDTNVPMIIYMFENGKMTSAGVLCKLSIGEQLVDFLMERYVTVDVNMEKYTATMLRCSGKIKEPNIEYGVGMQYSSSINGILVAYSSLKTNGSSTRGIDGIDFKATFKSMEKALK